MFTKTVLEKRLEDLTIAASSINTLCVWLIKHRVHFQAIVRIWFKKLVKARKDRKLIFMYLADDVTKKEHPNYVNEFGDHMIKVLEHLVDMNLDEKTNGMVERLIQTWRERKIFDDKRQLDFEKVWKVGIGDARNPLKRKEKLPSIHHDAPPIKQQKNGDGNQFKMSHNELKSPIITLPPTEMNPKLGKTLYQCDLEQVDGLDIFSEDDVTTPSTNQLKFMSEIKCNDIKWENTEYIEVETSKCEKSEYSSPKYEGEDEFQSKNNREPYLVTKLSIEDPLISDSQIERENLEINFNKLGKVVTTLEKERKALEVKVCGQDKELEDIKGKHLNSQKKNNRLEKQIQQKNLEHNKLIVASTLDKNVTANLRKSFIELQKIVRNFRKKVNLAETEINKIMEEKRILEVALKVLKEENEKIKSSNQSGPIAGEKASDVNLMACKEKSLSSVKEDGHCKRKNGCETQKSKQIEVLIDSPIGRVGDADLKAQEIENMTMELDESKAANEEMWTKIVGSQKSTLTFPKRTLIPNNVFVGGISSNTTESELHQLFSAFGNVKQTKIITDREGVSQNYGFVTFETEEEARVLHFLNDFHSGDKTNYIMLNGKNLRIAPAIRKQQLVGVEPYPTPSKGRAGTSQISAMTTAFGPTKFETLVPNEIFVNGFSHNTTESELYQLFSAFGNVKQTRIITDWADESKGQYGFVTFETEEEARRLQQAEANNFRIKGKQLNIGPAFKKQQPFGRQYEMSCEMGQPQPLMNGTINYLNGVPSTYSKNGMSTFTECSDEQPGFLGCYPWLPWAIPSLPLDLSSLKPP